MGISISGVNVLSKQINFFVLQTCAVLEVRGSTRDGGARVRAGPRAQRRLFFQFLQCRRPG